MISFLIFLVYFFVFVFGLIVGSFLNCVIYRLEKNENFLKGRSRCPRCQHVLSWQDLIPVFSFLILKRRCRYCQEKISLQYPIVEIITALLFLLIFNLKFLIFKQFQIFNFLNLFYYWIITSFLLVIFVYDLKHYIIFDKVIYPAIVLTLIFNLQFLISKQFQTFNYSILSALGTALFFLLIFLTSRGKWLGFGDVKLGFLMGLFLGFPNILVSLFFAYLIGAIIGIGLILAKKKTLKSEVPFGPFLVIGTFIALFLGQKIIDWYLGLFFYK